MTEKPKRKQSSAEFFPALWLTFFLLFAGWSFANAGSLSTEATNAVAAAAQQQGYVITGTVVDNLGEELIGVAVQLRSNMSIGTATDIDGNFSIRVSNMNDILVFTFIGMATQELRLVAGTTHYRVVMLEDATVLEEFVVETGIMGTRDRAGFTGAATTYSQEALRETGTINVLQALRTLDPAFIMVDNIAAGSDPNQMATFELRGQTGLDIVGVGGQPANVNMPLFIMDGFEVTIQEVNDLDISRIHSVTLLKDAGSTAIFGARGANGVIVIETVRPVAGRVRVHYNLNMEVSWADLGQYNMMNAREKLEFEVLAGVFGNLDNPNNVLGIDRHRNALRRIEQGVDTDWLRIPVRTAFTHNQSASITGGDQIWQFTTGLNYRNVQGVMRGSNRETFGGNVRVQYRGVNNLTVSNNLSVSSLNAETGGWGAFRNFVAANPTHSPFDEFGNIPRFLETQFVVTAVETLEERPNPLHNATLFSFDDTHTFTLTNNTRFNWRILSNLEWEGNLSVLYTMTNNTTFEDPRNTRFAHVAAHLRGVYTEGNNNRFRTGANTRVSYGTTINRIHNFNFVGRIALEDSRREGSSFRAMGFPLGARPVPSFAFSYPEDSRPTFTHAHNRSASFVVTAHYNYAFRYLLDLTLNREGSNTFGSEHLFTNVWSAGTGWNISRESFAQNWDWLSNMIIRANYGTTANQNRGFLTTDIYGFYPGSGLFGTAAVRRGIGNPHLQWAIVGGLSGGIEMAFHNPRLRLQFDAFRNVSNPQVIDIPQKASTGVTTHPINFGRLETVGYTFRVNYTPIHNTATGTMVTINMTGGSNRSIYNGFGGLMEFLNSELWGHEDATIENMLQRWEDGSRPDAMWAVPSLGIDPMSGREIFLRRDGTHTFHFDPADRVLIAHSRPNLEGTIGATVRYRQLRANFAFRYRLGAHKFNRALFDRVENINRNALRDNQDRRALYDRWQRPGDIAQFRGISLTDQTQMSSRFIQRYNRFTGESVNIVWNFERGGWITNIGLQNLNAGVSMRDIFYLSNIRAERGINFPFARSVTFNINATF